MPNPKKYDNQSDWMAACVPIRKGEGDKFERSSIHVFPEDAKEFAKAVKKMTGKLE